MPIQSPLLGKIEPVGDLNVLEDGDGLPQVLLRILGQVLGLLEVLGGLDLLDRLQSLLDGGDCSIDEAILPLPGEATARARAYEQAGVLELRDGQARNQQH
jgi:hypothetical protein